jgi:hypothetical protein
MTPQQTANELVEKFSNYACWGRFDDEYENLQNSKRCASIAVDEIILEMGSIMLPNPFKQYWQEVKQEIEKL